MFGKEEAVLIIKGRHAGKKAVIIDDIASSKGRKVVTIAGLEKTPTPITEDMTAKQKKGKSTLRAFVKTMNIRHIIATRYTMENVFNGLEIRDLSEVSERVEMVQEVEAMFKKAYEANPTHWVFKKQRI